MKKEIAVTCFNDLNKVIKGSLTIMNNIDAGKNINTEKALRACFLNTKLLADTLKTIVFELSKHDTRFGTSHNPFNIDDILKGG